MFYCVSAHKATSSVAYMQDIKRALNRQVFLNGSSSMAHFLHQVPLLSIILNNYSLA